jgi:phospholipase C
MSAACAFARELEAECSFGHANIHTEGEAVDDITRRRFLAGAAGVAGAAGIGALALPGCSTTTTNSSGPSGSTPSGGGSTTEVVSSGTQPLPKGKDAPFDTVVVLMMENRSFDHMLGWLPGANGKQAGLQFADQDGKMQSTYPLAPDFQGCELQDPFHFWQHMAIHYDDGKCDGFLKTQPLGDHFPIGYYGPNDLPILGALAQGYTCYDNYFCSMLGPTWPNRLYQLCATTDIEITGFYPEGDAPRPVNLELAIFDRLKEANKTSSYYTWGEQMTGLFASKKYDSITYPITQFWDDAKEGKLANVVFVDPDYTGHAELAGTSNDYHPYGSVQVAEAFVAQVHDALKDSPQWDKMVFVLNFDENGGFYDHVKPPACQDDTVLTGAGPFPDLKTLGFRVPAIAMGPFAPQKIESSGPYEHCSILKMIEWRWDLEPMTLRDKTANNLADTLDFSKRRDPITLPSFTPAPAEVCTNTKHIG